MIHVFSAIKRILKNQYFKLLEIYYVIAGHKVECNICHYKTNKFNSDSWHLHCICPKCGSQLRERLLVASFTLPDQFSFARIIKGKSVLHFAPEKLTGEIIQGNAKVYKTADLLTEGYSYDKIDYFVDISSMKEIMSETFDCVIACDVLEHVPDHISAIKETYRVLKKGGYAVFTVPQKDNLEITYEDLTIKDPEERTKTFGQFDHLKIFGNDFGDMLSDNGFEVAVISEKNFDKEIVERYVLFPPVLSKNPLATNYRKIFFGRKN